MATYKITQNSDPFKALPGEQSPGVLALQQSLNALGAGLKEDSQYGPLTQKAFEQYGPSLPKAPQAAPLAPYNPPEGVIPTDNGLVKNDGQNTPVQPQSVNQGQNSANLPTPPAGTPAPTPAAPTDPNQNQNQNQPQAPTQPQQNNQQNANIPTLSTNLQVGSRGPDVSQIQNLLGVQTDGVFGPKTQAAVKSFQAANGLVVDGIVGPKTFAALTKSRSNVGAEKSVGDGMANSTQNKNQPKVLTGNKTIDSLLSLLENQSPQKSFTEVYKQVYQDLGINTIKSDYESQAKEFTALQEKKAEEAEEVNNNPWLSEGLRRSKLKKLDEKYEKRELILTNKMKLLEGQIQNGREDARFMAGKIMDQLEQADKLDNDIIIKAIEIAEKEAEAENKLIEVSPGASLYDPKSGRITFTAPKVGTGGGSGGVRIGGGKGGGGGSGVSDKDLKQGFSDFIKTGKDGEGQVFGNPQGKDGFSDPYVYITAFNSWPGTTNDFLAKFPVAKHVNPASFKLLPEAIRPAPKKGSASATSLSDDEFIKLLNQ